MEKTLRLRNAGISKSTAKANLVEVTFNYTVVVKVEGQKGAKTTEGTQTYSVWIPKSVTTKTMSGELYVPDWMIQLKEEEIAEKLAFTTVEILVLED